MMIEMRQIPRQPVMDGKDYSMSVISFKRLDWTDLVVSVVDMSPQGAGIEVEKRIEPGFVWFSGKVNDKKCGLLMWSKQRGSRYRGGIRFVPISPDEEQSVQEKLEGSGPLKDPTIVVDTILDSLKKSGGGSIVQTK
jgi:hypothetical protein